MKQQCYSFCSPSTSLSTVFLWSLRSDRHSTSPFNLAPRRTINVIKLPGISLSAVDRHPRCHAFSYVRIKELIIKDQIPKCLGHHCVVKTAIKLCLCLCKLDGLRLRMSGFSILHGKKIVGQYYSAFSNQNSPTADLKLQQIRGDPFIVAINASSLCCNVLCVIWC